jgi:F0F1-type ATP synthase assembly protein I
MSGGKSPFKVMKAFAIGSTLGVQFAASVLLGFWGGRFLDHRLGSEPWLMVAGVLLGVAAGTIGIYRVVSRLF